MRTALTWAIAAVALTLAAAGGWYWHFSSWAERPVAANTELRIDLAPGQSLSSLADQLKAQEYIVERRYLMLLGRLTSADTRLQAGEYLLAANASPREVLTQLTRGEVITYDFRIEEGVTIAVVLAALKQAPKLEHKIQAADAAALHAELNLDTAFAEGMFFPDTYQYRKGDSDRGLLLRAHTAMQAKAAEAWQARRGDVHINSPTELVILASIIEKETGLESDRGQISQVFHKRLAERMLLQTDPTVIYALGKAFDGNLTRAHLRIESPFNTYRTRGLPPTPIALPSAASLLAAAQPAEGDYLYFVAKGNGASQFSRTLEEHNAAVRRYQLGQSSN